MFIISFYACKDYFNSSQNYKSRNPDPALHLEMQEIFQEFEELFYKISWMLYQTNENPMFSIDIMHRISQCVNKLKYISRNKPVAVYECISNYFKKLHLNRYQRRLISEFMEVIKKISDSSIAHGRNILRLVIVAQIGQGNIPELDRDIASEDLERIFLELRGVENLIHLSAARILNFKEAVKHYLSDQITPRTTYFLDFKTVDFVLDCSKFLSVEYTSILLQIFLRNSDIDPKYWSSIFNCAVLLKRFEDAFNQANKENLQEIQPFFMDIDQRKIAIEVLEKMRLLNKVDKKSLFRASEGGSEGASEHALERASEDIAKQQLFLLLEYFAHCGSPYAQWRLAFLYRYNIGVPEQVYQGNMSDSEKEQSRLKATHHWTKVAALSGHSLAQIEWAISSNRESRLLTGIEPKILEHITRFLNYDDYPRFARTCKSTLEFAKGSFRYWEWGSALTVNSGTGICDTGINDTGFDKADDDDSELTRKSPKHRKFS